MLDAIIADGPNKGLTLRQCIAFGLALGPDREANERKAQFARNELVGGVNGHPPPVQLDK